MLPDAVFDASTKGGDAGTGGDSARRRGDSSALVRLCSSLYRYVRSLLDTPWVRYSLLGALALCGAILVGRMVRRRLPPAIAPPRSRPAAPAASSAWSGAARTRTQPSSTQRAYTAPAGTPAQRPMMGPAGARSRLPMQSMAQQTSRARRILGQMTDVARSAVAVTHAPNANPV